MDVNSERKTFVCVCVCVGVLPLNSITKRQTLPTRHNTSSTREPLECSLSLSRSLALCSHGYVGRKIRLAYNTHTTTTYSTRGSISFYNLIKTVITRE